LSTAQAGCMRLKIVYGVTVITFAGKRPASRVPKTALRKRPDWSRPQPQPQPQPLVPIS
jgi:hypothetical protein